MRDTKHIDLVFKEEEPGLAMATETLAVQGCHNLHVFALRVKYRFGEGWELETEVSSETQGLRAIVPWADDREDQGGSGEVGNSHDEILNRLLEQCDGIPQANTLKGLDGVWVVWCEPWAE